LNRVINNESRFDAKSRLIIFDELHKYRQWKNLLKGIYDKQKDQRNFLVTGSARLNIYRKGGDSLLGRYFHYRLHPFSLHELLQLPGNSFVHFRELPFQATKSKSFEAIERLMHFGGFPEPLFAGNARTLRRWQNERLDRLIKEDSEFIRLLPT